MVEVILLERVERLGQMGDVVKVRPGFARNFLLPQKKALRATKDNLKVFETQKAQLVADNLKRKDEAAAVASKMDGLKVTAVRQAGESGQLYGSVTARDVAEAVVAGGFTVARSQIVIDKPIKTTGLHTVRVSLHPEVSVAVTMAIAPSQDEADAILRGEKLRRNGDDDEDDRPTAASFGAAARDEEPADEAETEDETAA